MPIIPKDSKTKVILFFILFFIIAGVIYFRYLDSRVPVVVSTFQAEESLNIPEGTIMEDGVMEDIFEGATTTEEKVIKGSYKTYSPGMISEADNGAKVVLFFNAAWCSTCQSVDRDLTSREIPEGLIILSVDYDSYITLKKEYDVTYEHTFAWIDGEGDLIKKWSGGGLEDIIEAVK